MWLTGSIFLLSKKISTRSASGIHLWACEQTCAVEFIMKNMLLIVRLSPNRALYSHIAPWHAHGYVSTQIYSTFIWKYRPAAVYSRSSFLLRNLVRFISFLYLCFFIFNFLCLLTLIARQTSLELPSPDRFMRRDFSQADRRVHMRVKKGWYGGGQRDGIWWWLWPSSINNCSEVESSRKGEAIRWYVIWPSGCVRSTTVTRVV